MKTRFTKRATQRTGVTLLELLLALALSSLLLGIVAMAINITMKALDTRRNDLEEAQLARAILQTLADDLRSSVQQQEVDYSKMEEYAKNVIESLDQGEESSEDGPSQGNADGQGGGDNNQGENSGENNAGGGGAGGGDPGGGETGGDSGSDAALAEDPLDAIGEEMLEEEALPQSVAESVVIQAKPGLYGSQYELQVDMSRLPRADEYDPSAFPIEDAAAGSIPSDVKTVAWFLRGDPLTDNQSDPSVQTASAVATGANEGESQISGLVRRQVDRAVTQFSNDYGGDQSLQENERLLAPEVTALEFEYFDGTTWVTEWDSETQGGLPKAVKITLAIRSSRRVGSSAGGSNPATSTNSSLGGISSFIEDGQLLYQQIVHLPAAEAASATSASTITEDLLEDGLDAGGDLTGGDSSGGGNPVGGGSPFGGGNPLGAGGRPVGGGGQAVGGGGRAVGGGGRAVGGGGNPIGGGRQ